MKKILMALAAAAILAGCSKNEQENVEGFTPKQIKFTNLNDKLTRAANDGNDSYRVYAAWSGGTGWFINDQVSASDVPSGGPYYWPASGSVDFYAWAPADVAATGTYPTLSIAYEVPANANKDFTIAAPQLGLTSGTVGLAFSHMLAKITVTAQLHDDLSDAGYQLSTTGLTASLDVQSTGGTIDPTATTPAWASPNSTSATYAGAASYMIMPQSSVGCKVKITAGITITKNGTTIYSGDLQQYTIATGNIPADEFEKGKHYLLKMIIDADSHGGGTDPIFNIIEFESSIAEDWTAVTPDPELPQP